MARIEGPRIPPTARGGNDPNQQYLSQLISSLNAFIQAGGDDMSGIKSALSKLHLPSQMQAQLQSDLLYMQELDPDDKNALMGQAGMFLCDAASDYVAQKYPLSKAASSDLSNLLSLAKDYLAALGSHPDIGTLYGCVAEAQSYAAQTFPSVSAQKLATIQNAYQELINLGPKPSEPILDQYFQDFQGTLPTS